MTASVQFTHAESIEIDCSPQQVYETVSDVTRTGEWSPICNRCEWDEGDGPRLGATFIGYNEIPGRAWQTTSRVVAADPAREFAWWVNGGLVRWSYTMEPVRDGTRLTESWDFTEAGRQFFRDKYGDAADVEIGNRAQAAHDGIPVTLAAIKRICESG